MNSFNCCEDLVLLQYVFLGKEKVIPPTENSRTYPSVNGSIENNLKKGFCPKKAVFTVESEVGGLENARNASELPKRSQAYEINRKNVVAEKEEDPLKKLLLKQREQGSTGHGIVKRISCDADSYTVALFTSRMIDNISNYCCSDNLGFLSAFCLDFTFELGDYFALVTTFKNTSLYVKNTTRCPSMLGPVLLCHRKNEKVVKILFDAMLEERRSLENSLKVIGMDGEKAISNMACLSFPRALLLLCLNHARENIRRKITIDLKMSKEEADKVLEEIFGADTTVGLVHSLSPDDYDMRVEKLSEKWRNTSEIHDRFASYFVVYKQEQFKYHLCRYAVEASEVVDCPSFFYNNSCEFMNKLMKLWQGKKKIDCLKFAEQVEDIAKSQESDVLRAFMHLL